MVLTGEGSKFKSVVPKFIQNVIYFSYCEYISYCEYSYYAGCCLIHPRLPPVCFLLVVSSERRLQNKLKLVKVSHLNVAFLQKTMLISKI